MRLLLCLGNAALGGAIAVRSGATNATTTDTDIESSSDSITSTTNYSNHDVGGYIMQGLSESSQNPSARYILRNGTDSTTTLHTTPNSTVMTQKTITADDDWQACQSSQVAWSDAYSKTLSPTVYTTTSWAYYNETYNVTSGIGDVYTTIDGIPHAHGSFTPTSVGTFMQNFSEPHVRTSTVTLNVTFASPSPTCSIPFAQCSKMWQSYLLSLGITTPLEDATEPVITPMPTNRPRCSIGDASWSHSYATWGLFYWPTATASGSPSPTGNITAAPVTAVRGNMTFTSPSVYLSFNTLYAIQGHDLDEVSWSQTVPLGAMSKVTTLLGGFFPEPVGPTFRNKIMSLNPTELSSVVANFGPGVNTASAISEIAHGGPDYAKWISALKDSRPVPTANNSYLIRSLDYAHLTMPDLEDYYLQPSVAPGCNNPHGPHPGCSTVFEGAYRAQLHVPQQVRNLAPEWKGCGIPLDGVYDPPQALTAARSEAMPVAPMPVTSKMSGGSTSGEARPQSTVSDHLPAPTTLPSPTPDPVIEGQSSDDAPTPTEANTAPDSKPSAIADPVKPSVNSDSGQSASPTTQSSNGSTAFIAIGTQTFAVPAPGVSEPTFADPQGPMNALSALAAAQSTEPDPPTAQDSPSMAAAISLGDSTFVVASPQIATAAVTIGTAVLTPGGPAATIHDQVVSVGSQHIVVDSKTMPYATYQVLDIPAHTSVVAAVLPVGSSSMVIASPTGTELAVTIGSKTLTPGGSAVMINGHEVSAASNGVMIDFQLMAYSTIPVSDAQEMGAIPPTTSGGTAVVTAGGHTYTLYQPDAALETTISGQAISVGNDAVVVGSQTVRFSSGGDTTAASDTITSSSDRTSPHRTTSTTKHTSSISGPPPSSATTSQSTASSLTSRIGSCLAALVAVFMTGAVL